MPDQQAASVSQLVEAILSSDPDVMAPTRIITLMGPNGSGKSKTLTAIRDRLRDGGIEAFAISANRAFTAPRQNIAGARYSFLNSAEDFEDLLSTLMVRIFAKDTDEHNLDAPIRVSEIFNIVFKQSRDADWRELGRYKEELYRWDQGLAVRPTKPQSQLEQLAKHIEKILGYRTTIRQPTPPREDTYTSFEFESGNARFGFDGLSDGEKQILILSIFLFSTNTQDHVFLVDEPELHLNETRASEIWSAVEDNFPSSKFIYATHSIVFATRPNVQRQFFINNFEVVELNTSEPVPQDIVAELVGTRIQLLRNPRPIIFCEDQIHEILLPDLLEDEYEFVRVGSFKNVINAVAADESWNRIRSSGVPFCGVIDRDTRSEEECDNLRKKGVVTLPVYDAESVLVAPAIAIFYLRLHTGLHIPTREFEVWLTGAAERRLTPMLEVTASHLEHASPPKIIHGSDPRKSDWMPTLAPMDNLISRFNVRAKALSDALGQNDIPAILKLYRGKDLYRMLSNESKSKFNATLARNPIEQYRVIRSQEQFWNALSKLDWLPSFQNDVVTALALRR